MVSLVFLCGFQFFFLPFIHYHPDNTHAHAAELSPHQHRGHFHSPELETLTHLINHHDHSQGEDHHHSEPFDGTDSDNYEIELYKSNLKSGKPFKIVKNGDVRNRFIIAAPILIYIVAPDDFSIENSRSSEIFRSRAPPSFLI